MPDNESFLDKSSYLSLRLLGLRHHLSMVK